MQKKNYILIFVCILGLIILMTFFNRKILACGLKNHYNVCYINSTIQSLFSCVKFIEMVENCEAKTGTVLFEMKLILKDMKDKEIVDKRPLYKNMARMSKNLFKYDNKPGYTEDFLEFLINRLEKELSSFKNDDPGNGNFSN
ncbi:putative Peptidase C19, ubiquitin carboxyl-terminal hydrolase 2 protein, partial [Pseudoloma neurophilia]